MALSTKNLSAVILCGGKGERLRPLTSSIPKPLVPIKGRPILDYLLEHLEQFESIKKIIVASGYKSEKIEEYFQNNHGNQNYTEFFEDPYFGSCVLKFEKNDHNGDEVCTL